MGLTRRRLTWSPGEGRPEEGGWGGCHSGDSGYKAPPNDPRSAAAGFAHIASGRSRRQRARRPRLSPSRGRRSLGADQREHHS